MLKKLREFMSASEPDEKDIEKDLRLATAALLVEVARADFERTTEEEKALAVHLETFLKLPREEVRSIISSATNKVDKATSLYEFTSLINDNCSNDQKFSLMCAMWHIAHADGDIDRYEEHIIRRVSELIHLSHSDYIRAKLLALK